MRNRKKNKNILDTPLPSSQTQLHSPLLPLLSPSRENMGKSEEFLRGTGNGCVTVCSLHIVSAASSLSHSSLALLWCASHIISLYKLLQCRFLKKLAPLWFLSMRCIPSGIAPSQMELLHLCFHAGPHFLSENRFLCGIFSMGSCRSFLQCRFFTGHSSFKALSNCSSVGTFMGSR